MEKTRLLPAFLYIISISPVCLNAQNLLIPLLHDSTHYYYYEANGIDLKNYSRSAVRYNASELAEVSSYESTWIGSPTTYYRDTFVYDNKNRQVLKIAHRSLDSPQGPWEKWSLDTFEYDDQDRLVHFTDYYGDGDNWVPYFAEYYWFDEAMHEDSSLYVIWDNSLSLWGNRYREFTKRQADGKVVQYNEDIWDDTLNDWRDLQNDYYTYLPDGRLLLHKYNEVDVNYVNAVRTDSLVYDINGLPDSAFLFTKYSNSPVQYIAIRDYTFDADGNLESTVLTGSSDNGATYTASARQFFAPGDGIYSNDYAYESLELPNSQGGYYLQWDITKAFTYLGDNRVLYVTQRRQASGGPVHLQTLDSVWYHLPAALSAHLPGAASNAECRFANPLAPGGLIVCDAPDESAVLTLRIADLNGRVAGTEKVRPGEPWRPSLDLAEGIYFLTIWQNGEYLGARKLIWTR